MTPNKYLKNRPGIYGIRNLVNNKIYIGKTKCMYRRCYQYLHAVKLQKLDHINEYLLNAVNKAGIDNFEFFPLQFAEISELNDLEIAWMIQLKSIKRNYGYNLRMDTSTGMVVSNRTSNKIRNNLRKQWRDGVRKDHGAKLKKSWENNPQRRTDQSKLMSSIKTKYEYQVHHPNGIIETCDYKRLVDLGIKSVIGNFCRNHSNDDMCKGFRIIRCKL